MHHSALSERRAYVPQKETSPLGMPSGDVIANLPRNYRSVPASRDSLKFS